MNREFTLNAVSLLATRLYLLLQLLILFILI